MTANNLGAYLRLTGDPTGAEASYRRALDEFQDWITLSDRQTVLEARVRLETRVYKGRGTFGRLGHVARA